MSICEIYYPIINNKTVIMSNENEFNNPTLLGKLINKRNIDYIFITPSRYENYINDEIYRKSINSVKVILVGGENIKESILRSINRNSNGKIYNLFGPTETTIMCSISELTEMYINNKNNLKKITIGTPLCNSKIYILDKYLKPVPIGVIGEIFIGGYGVGKGYLNRDDLTKEKFLKCPFVSGNDKFEKFMYRSGDLGKWNEYGDIEYIGRLDFQVKIYGQRIELSEIENVLKEMEDVQQAIVIDKNKQNG
ncbi:hypothetical protein U3516DRAFT_792009 [Neocallimastix sp. 'constans']